MAKKVSFTREKRSKEDSSAFLLGLKDLLSVFPTATTAEKGIILGLVMIPLILTSIVGFLTLPWWATCTALLAVALFPYFAASALIVLDRRRTAVPQCRHIPIYPLEDSIRKKIRAGLEEIRWHFSEELRKKHPEILDTDIRANLFLLAQIRGGLQHGSWKLVIDSELAMNMGYEPELGIQLAIGQGATGLSFLDGDYRLTRADSGKRGRWETKFKLTKELKDQLHPELQWIVTIPLNKSHTKETLGVLNVDGLTDLPSDDLLHKIVSSLREIVRSMAETLERHPSYCVSAEMLGGL